MAGVNSNFVLIQAINSGNNDYAQAMIDEASQETLNGMKTFEIEDEIELEVNPLIMAVIRGNYEIVRLLLLKGANPNIANRTGATPLTIATETLKKDLIQLLLEHGAKAGPAFNYVDPEEHPNVVAMLQNSIRGGGYTRAQKKRKQRKNKTRRNRRRIMRRKRN